MNETLQNKRDRLKLLRSELGLSTTGKDKKFLDITTEKDKELLNLSHEIQATEEVIETLNIFQDWVKAFEAGETHEDALEFFEKEVSFYGGRIYKILCTAPTTNKQKTNENNK